MQNSKTKPRFHEWAQRQSEKRKAFQEALLSYRCWCGRPVQHNQKAHYPVCSAGTSRCPVEGGHTPEQCIVPHSRKRVRETDGFYGEQ